MTSTLRGHAAMLAFSALVAGSFSLGSLAAPFIDPAVLNAVRFVLAAVVLWGALLVTGGVKTEAFRAPWRYLVLAGLFVTYFVLMFEGLKTGPPVSLSAVFTLTPLMAAGFGWLVLRQIMTGRMALALCIGGLGALWVVFRGDPGALMRFELGRGELIYFLGCISHALYAPMVKRLNRGENAAVFSLGILIAGAVILVLFAWNDLWATDWASLPPIVWIAIVYVALIATSLTFVLLQYGALHLPSAKVMAYTYLTPSWVILWQIALGQGLPEPIVLVGIGLTVVALLLLLRNDSLA